MTRYGDITRSINGLESPQGSIELHRTIYFPCAMALRLMPCSPRRRIRLVTVAAGLMANLIRSDRSRHRQLGTSNGCRDHTVLPYAIASFVLRAGIAHEKLALRFHCAPTLPRPPHPYPTFVTTRDRPFCRERTGQAGSADLPDGGSEIFLQRGLDRFFLICPSGYGDVTACGSSAYLCASHDEIVAGTKPTSPYRMNCSTPESDPREP
jgi:hypothetical protein